MRAARANLRNVLHPLKRMEQPRNEATKVPAHGHHEMRPKAAGHLKALAWAISLRVADPRSGSRATHSPGRRPAPGWHKAFENEVLADGDFATGHPQRLRRDGARQCPPWAAPGSLTKYDQRYTNKNQSKEMGRAQIRGRRSRKSLAPLVAML